MSVLAEVVKELCAMFLADARLTFAILALVALVAGLSGSGDVSPVLSGGVLLLGALAILVLSASWAAKAKA